MKFEKGKPKTGGRQPGQPNRVTLDIKAFARTVIEDPGYQAKLQRRLRDGRAPQLEVLLHYYAYGKPKQELIVDRQIRVIVQRHPAPPLDVQAAIVDRSTDDVETEDAQ